MELEDKILMYVKKYRIYFLLYFMLMFIGILCHGYMFFNKLPNFDDATALRSKGTTFKLGRWFLPFTKIITNGISIPVVNGLFSVSCIILAAFLICDVLKIYGGAKIFLVGCILICFPTVAGTFTFMFTADSYMLGLFFAVFGVWCAIKWNKYIWGGYLSR